MSNNDIVDFAKSLSDIAKRVGNRKVEIDTDDVRTLVRRSPEAAREYIRATCILASSNPELLGMAMNVAAAYAVEFNDHTLMQEVADTAKQIGREDVLDRALSQMRPKSGPQMRPESENAIRLLEVQSNDLQNCNIKPFINLFSLGHIKASGMATNVKVLRGKCAITFPLDDDPRHVIRIPSSRKFTQKLHSEIPHLPYFLTPIPEIGALHSYFGCLIDESLIIREHAIDVSSEAFVPILLKCTEGIIALCKLIDDDVRRACNDALSIFPQEMRHTVMKLMGIL